MSSLLNTRPKGSLGGLRSATVPATNDLKIFEEQKRENLLELIHDNQSHLTGLNLTPEQVLTLRLLLQNSSISASTSSGRRLSTSSVPSHVFDYHGELATVRSQISDDIEDTTVDQVFAIFHNQKHSMRRSSMNPLKRFQSAVHRIIKKKSFCKALCFWG